LLDSYKINDCEEQNVKKWPWSIIKEEFFLKKAKQSFDNKKLQSKKATLELQK